jgi:serine/threonine protein kinase
MAYDETFLISSLLINPRSYIGIRPLNPDSPGSFYLVKDQSDRLFAMKSFRYSQPTTQQQRFFLKEIESISSARHSALLPIVGFSLPSACDRTATILTEFIPRAIVPDRLDLTSKLVVLFGIAGGLRCCHSKGIVNGNFRVSNLFLNAEGEPLVGYFGLGRLEAKSVSLAVLAHTAPEVLKGGVTDAKADVFGFGILVWEIMSGRAAFEGFTEQEAIVEHIVGGGRPSLDTVPPVLGALIERCWAADAASRPDSDTIVAELSGSSFLLEGADTERLEAYRSRVFEKPQPPQTSNEANLIEKRQQQIDELKASHSEEIAALRAIVAELKDANTELKAATRDLRREVNTQTAILEEHAGRMKSYATDLTNAGLHAQAFREKQQRLANYSRQGAEKIEAEAAEFRAKVDAAARSPRVRPRPK